MEWENHRVLACNRMFTGSKLFNSQWDSDKYDIMMVFGWKKDKWVVSLYSDKEDVNVGLSAYKYGGGGHRKAAGFQCDVLPFKEVM
jgi:nanoRNase/pAp phosphatase (c-di-AMP/oligoRNAs hydrolase)